MDFILIKVFIYLCPKISLAELTGNFDYIGSGNGTGYNVNVAWNWDNMGDAEYMLACQHLLIPIATEVCEMSLRKLLAGISSDSEVAI